MGVAVTPWFSTPSRTTAALTTTARLPAVVALCQLHVRHTFILFGSNFESVRLNGDDHSTAPTATFETTLYESDPGEVGASHSDEFISTVTFHLNDNLVREAGRCFYEET